MHIATYNWQTVERIEVSINRWMGIQNVVYAWLLSCFSPVWLCATLRTVACRLLCPWDSPGKNTGVDSHSLLQGIFLTQGWNQCLLCLLHWQEGSLPLAPSGKLDIMKYYTVTKRNSVLINATTWMKPDNIMLSKRSQI